MTVALMVGATVLLFGLARTRARRWGGVVTWRDPLMVFLASAVVVEAVLLNVDYTQSLTLALGTVCALTDRQTGYIFNVVLGSAAALLIPFVVATGDLQASVLGAGVCGGAMLFLYVVTRGRGLGLGDVKLAALIGGGLAMPAGLEALGAAFVVGALTIVATALASRVRARGAVAFGPYLALGSMLSVALTGIR